MSRLSKALVVGVLSTIVVGCTTSDPAPITELDRGLLLLEEKRYEEARIHFMAMHARDPQNPYVNLNLGAALDSLGRDEEALEFYRVAVANGENAPVFLAIVDGEEIQTSTVVATVARDNIEQMNLGAAPQSSAPAGFRLVEQTG